MVQTLLKITLLHLYIDRLKHYSTLRLFPDLTYFDIEPFGLPAVPLFV